MFKQAHGVVRPVGGMFYVCMFCGFLLYGKTIDLLVLTLFLVRVKSTTFYKNNSIPLEKHIMRGCFCCLYSNARNLLFAMDIRVLSSV